MDTKPKEEFNKLDSKTAKSDIEDKNVELENSIEHVSEEIKDDDLLTLHKIHSILLNCINLSKKYKLEFCNSQRYFMKLYLKKMREQLEK
ncbi:MAG TPA: hypothetical protein ENI29_18900 [bacterium]|nr:hypothetical protein [bacterium]